MNKSLKQRCDKRLESLRSERSYYMPLWCELSDYILSHRGRFLNDKNNKRGRKRNTKSINMIAHHGANIMAAGLMAGLTNPAQKWFRLKTPDEKMMDYRPVQTWLEQVEKIMEAVFARSNFYKVLPGVYKELAVFGTASMGMFSDFENVIRCQQYTIGQYMLGINGKNEVDTHYREYQASVGQLVKEFGLENCSQTVQSAYRNNNLDTMIDVVHVYEPNNDRKYSSPFAKDMPIRSMYYEKGQKNDEKYLKQSGFEEKSIFTPRWEVVGEGVYADTCPGIVSLGDTKALQLQEKKKAIGVDKLIDPPLQVPSYLQNSLADGGLFPGEKLFVPNTQHGIKSIYDMNLPIGELREDMNSIENRINTYMYVDLFLMMATSDRRNITATEIEERHGEKLIVLSPMIEQNNHELLDPAIDRCFALCSRAEILPEPPEELLDQDLKVEYVSSLAQAQNSMKLKAIDATAAFAMNIAQVYPEARQKFNAEKAIGEYGRSVGVSANIIRSDDEMAEIAQAEAQAAQQQQMMEGMAQAAQTAKTASEIDTDSAIQDLLPV